MQACGQKFEIDVTGVDNYVESSRCSDWIATTSSLCQRVPYLCIRLSDIATALSSGRTIMAIELNLKLVGSHFLRDDMILGMDTTIASACMTSRDHCPLFIRALAAYKMGEVLEKRPIVSTARYTD